MALLRCSRCNTPLTEDEIASGACPLCAAEVQPPAPVVMAPPPKPTVHGPSATRTILFLVGGALVFCLLPFSVIFYASLPDAPEKDPEAAKKEPAKVVQVVPKKVPEPEKKVIEEKKVDETKSLAPDPEPEVVKKVEEKKEEPKKVEVEKEQPKKEEPKKPAPEPVRLANAYLPLLSEDAITIDGDLDDWKGVRPQLLNVIERGKPTRKVVVQPKAQKAYFAYNPRGILIAVDVTDTSGELEKAGRPAKGMWPFWDNDAVEVFIDTLNRRPRHRGEPNAHQFVAFPFGVGDAGVGGYESRILGSAWTVVPIPNVGKYGLPRAGKKTATGWTLEMLIPNSALRHGDMKPGQTIGFEVQVDTGTNVFYHWANDNPDVRVSTNPSSWGEILLAGTDAKLEVLSMDDLPVHRIALGEPLRIRVTDADTNLDPLTRERLSVTLVAKSGDRKTLDLKETKINSGIFTGTINTRMKSRPEPGVLELLPDDAIAIEFLDRVRADGARNTPVRMEVITKAPR